MRFIEAGYAYGMVPLLQAETALAAGRLVDVAAGQALDVPLTWHAWDIQTPLTRTRSDAVIATARKWLLQD